ncbi:hypothetical protein ACFQZE_24470 [Paenibacillus sp. GCM10027627]|uniref:rolling circle replication-associated protein n=1 Tax=unclassified Paenibacillus TaxID=185978 RepID=UPI00363F583B
MSSEEDKQHYASKVLYYKRLENNRWMSDDFRRQLRKGRRADRALDDEITKGAKSGSRIKVIVCGPVVEKYEYTVPVQTGKKTIIFDPETGEVLNGGRTKQVELNPETGEIVKIDRKPEAKRTNARRSKMNLRRLVLANFSNMDKFVTLTFRDGTVQDVTNVLECNKEFDKFLKRLRREYGDFKYCRVVEFQDANNRGAIHYHCILTLPYVPYEKLGHLWRNGFVGINAIDKVDNVGAYIQKYMTKDFNDDRLAGKKAFSTSQNLDKPIILHGREAYQLAEKYLEDKEKVFANSYDSEHHGLISYSEYNMNRGESDRTL